MLEKTIGLVNASQPHGQSSEKLFDADVALQRLDSDVELFDALVSIFQQDSVDLFAKLSSSLVGGDLAGVERAAHSLKGLAANFEANATTEVAFEVEQMARAGQTNGLEDHIKKLGVRLEALRAALAERDAD